MKKLSLFTVILGLLGFGIGQVSAYVGVEPHEVTINQSRTFILGVSSEKPVDTTSVRLVIPTGLAKVTPNVKPGWKMIVKRDGDAVTEITWTGGIVPAEQRDEFVFSAQVPKDAGVLQWKVYQTYADKSVVAWDQESGDAPFSKTSVINDLAVEATPAPAKSQSPVALIISMVALAISIVGVLKRRSEDI